MQSNIAKLNKKNPAYVQVLKKKLSHSLMLLTLFSLAVALLAPKAHGFDVVKPNANLFEEKYVEQNDRHLQSLNAKPNTSLEISQNQEADILRMLENGFDMMGTSEFVSATISPELAKAYGQKIKADAVLVYDKPTSLTTNMVNMDGTEAGDKMMQQANEENTKNAKTIHYASYWAKLPMPVLGVHVVKLVKASADPAQEGTALSGLKIIAVIKDSPAAKANIATGDTLIKIGDILLEKSDNLYAAVARYQGQAVDVVYRHGEEERNAKVTLNARK